ncbi:hypothetical protein [Ottowia sp. VDI28]|uniref:hypothetical protein n=1 Tax=Ottowia sp. VDI28 TaxID=3133968 RepID=UPI003C30340B
MTTLFRPFVIASCVAGMLLAAGCASGRFASQGRFFQYASAEGKVFAEYDAHDATTCAAHLANLRKNNSHGADTLRCSADSAAASLPVSAGAADMQGTDFSFKFASREECQRMLPAITSGGRISRQCS